MAQAIQALLCQLLYKSGSGSNGNFNNTAAYENKVYTLPRKLDEKVAELHLAKVGATLQNLVMSKPAILEFLQIVPLNLMNIDIKEIKIKDYYNLVGLKL